MKIKYQGKDEETALSTVAALLSEKGVDAMTAIVEYRGEIYSSPEALDALALEEGAELNAYRIVSGG